jgi:hypothetical protein
MRPREELQTILENILGSRQVYFQPPESVKMSYPAIVYELNAIGTVHADNLDYHHTRSYDVKFITYDPDPDGEIVMKILRLPMCKFDRSYTSDNLNHFAYTLYF